MANEPKGLATKIPSMITRNILEMPVSGGCLAGLVPIHVHKTAAPLSLSVVLSLVSNTVFLRRFSLKPVCLFPVADPDQEVGLGYSPCLLPWVPYKMLLSHPISFEEVSL